ncbi:MAG TPA: hypothetical protein VN951_12565 [Pyrinomonadaceae bacterium]|nr:hypothetical protein [Pyrinomonadaceae bacterium]
MNLLDENSTYWLFGWLEANRITTVDQLYLCLGKKSSLDELRNVAEAWHDSTPPLPSDGINLVAGTGLRLDDLLTCPSLPCRLQQVDVLFRHAWHYFDRILLPDGVGDLLLHKPKAWTEDQWLETLFGWIALAMYIQEVGASGLVSYYPKHLTPPKDFLTRVLKINVDDLRIAVSGTESDIIREGTFDFHRVGKSTFHVSFDDPVLGVGTELTVMLPKGAEDNAQNIQIETAHSIIEEHLQNLEEDLHAHRHLKGSLGTVVWTHERILSRISPPNVRDVILKLSLPSIARIPIRELVAIRLAEGDSFAAFRAALTKAAQAMLDSNSNLECEDVSKLLVEETVKPELQKIEQRLRAAKRTLRRTTALSLTLAALAAKCGLLIGLAPVAAEAAGMAALVSGGTRAGAKYIQEKQAVELSDMYFLWKTLSHAR